MKKSVVLSIIFLLCVFGIFARQVFFGKVPLPADDLIGLYYPFRDIYAATNPNGIAYKNPLITDPILQQYPWRELSITLEKQLQLPLWNPYSFTGTPLLANFQSATFYPLNILYFVMPFLSAWSTQVLLQTLLLGLFTFLYLRFLRLHPLSQILGAITICFCGFSIAWYEWNIIVQTFLWLPLILLTKEKLLQKISTRWIAVLIFAECSAFFAGHLQTFFYVFFLANLYLLARIIQIVRKEKKNKFRFFIKKYIPFIFVGLGVFLITAIQWFPTLQFINLSARALDQQNWRGDGWFIPWQNLVQFIAPDFFGNPVTANYWGTWNYGELVGYIGIVPLFFAVYGIVQWKNWYIRFFTVILLLGFIFALPNWLSFLPYQLSLPYISTSQPTRLLSIIDFSLTILAAFGLQAFIEKKSKTIYIPIIFLLVCLAAAWFSVSLLHTVDPNNLTTAKHNLYLPSLLITITIVLIVITYFLKRKYIIYVCMLMVLLAVFDLLRFSDKFLPFVTQQYIYPSTAVMTYMRQHVGNYRIITDDRRILPPNVSMHYGLQTLEGYDPLYLKSYGQLIAYDIGDKQYGNHLPFNREMTAEPISNRLASFLGVKYILSLDSKKNDPNMKQVFSDGHSYIYENAQVYPRAFFVLHLSETTSSHQALINTSALQTDLRTTAIVVSNENIAQDFVDGNVSFVSYTPNTITLHTQNNGRGFLVLTDSYYPTWHAYIDGVETMIYPTDYTYRGIVVPAGQHVITFSDHLL